jgi:hypothetical protein
MRKRKIREEDEKWDTPSLEWIHRVRAEHARRRKGVMRPMPLARQKALAKKCDCKLISPPRRRPLPDAKFAKAATRVLKKNAGLYGRLA